MLDDKTQFLGWYDLDRKKTFQAKLDAACERFAQKFGGEVNTVLCNHLQLRDNPLNREGTEIQGVSYIARDTIYVGRRP